MDALKQQLLKVQQQLAGLSASQKMLSASLLVIMVMTLFYWSRFASTGEMEAVIDKPLSAEELTNVKNAVRDANIPFEERDGRVFVPTAKRAQVAAAMSNLALNGKLPTSYTQTETPEEKSAIPIMDSAAEKAQRKQDRVARKVEAIIRNWSGVTNAVVILAGDKRGGQLNPEKPTASVSIEFAGNPKDMKKYVEAARVQVSHVQPGLAPEDVGITVNGRLFDAQDDGFGGEGFVAKREEAERSFVQNVAKSLSYIKGIKVAVAVKVDTDSSVSTEHMVDKNNKVEAMLSQKSTSDENTQAVTGGEPGMTANVGVMTENTAASGRNSTAETSETAYKAEIGYKNRTVQSHAGGSAALSASIGIPESYYRAVWRMRNGSGTLPTITDMQPLIKEVSSSIRESVKNTLTITDDKAVSVLMFTDLEQDQPDAAATPLAALPAATGFGAKEIAVGALAVISLFMVSMMVRKSAPQPILAVAGPTNAAVDLPPSLMSIRDLASEVPEADLTMTGQELSEEALEARQVIEQVGTMVKQNPDVAANLIKRWMNQD